MRQGAADAAADAAQEGQVWGPGKCRPAPGRQGRDWGHRWKGAKCTVGLAPSPQGNQLRKMLLQNYLQNRKSSSRGDLPDPMSVGQYCLPAVPPVARLPRPWALPSARPPHSPPLK